MRSRILLVAGLVIVAGAGAYAATRFVRARRRPLASPHADSSVWWWLSYVDPAAPRGQRFIGVVIVNADDASEAEVRAAELGLAPAGVARATRLDPDSNAVRDFRYRLLSKSELAEARLI